MRCAIIIFSLLFFTQSSFAVEPYYTIVPIGGLLAVFIIAIFYMASQFLQNPQLEAWTKNELKELMIAGITISIVYVAMSVSTGELLGTITGYADKSDLISGIETKFNEFENALLNDYNHLIKASNRFGMLSSYTYSQSAGFIIMFGKTDAPLLGAGGMMQSLSILASSASNGILIYEAMKIFLKFFFDTSINYLLPIAFVFRMLPFTRKIGGTLIALALAGVFIFPFSMVLAATVHDSVGVTHSQMTSPDFEKITLKLDNRITEMCTDSTLRLLVSLSEYGWWAMICPIYCSIFAAACGPGAPACFAACIPPTPGGICFSSYVYPLYNYIQTAYSIASSIALVTSARNVVPNVESSGVIFDILTNKLIVPVSVAASLPLMEVVLVGALTVVGARSLSSALGGDIAISGLERLI
ncbi:MAG: hypothetical protein AB1391_01230 [Candidatus Micrarchaeota archaeon]